MTRGERLVAWAWTDRAGLEVVRVASGSDGTVAEGRVVVVLGGAPLAVRYRVRHDAGWRFREARVDGGDRTIEIARDAEGSWTVGDAARSDLDGCEDVDLMASPYTNTPPIAAAALAPGARRRSRVAWVLFPTLEVRAVEQEYERLDAPLAPPAATPLTSRYRYRNFDSGFVGELTVDADALVVAYGPWARV